MKLINFDFTTKVGLQPEQVNMIKDKKRPFPVTIELDLTNHCNHRCSFCVWGEHIAVDKSTLKRETIIKCIEDMKVLGSKAITFTGGGEAMIHKNFYEILSHSKNLGYDCGLITNGSVITQKNTETLLNNLKWIRFSMSGGDKESYFKVQGKDHFDLVCKNLKMLCDAKIKAKSNIKVGIRMLITEENIHTLIKLTKIIEEIQGINYLQIAPDHSSEDEGKFWHGDIVKKEKEIADNILKKKNIDFITSGFEILNTSNNKKENILNIPNKCYAHFFQIAIMADGRVAFCKNARFDDKFIIGNINDNTIEEVWNSEKNKEYEQWVKPSNCGLTCKNIRVNLGMQDIINSMDKDNNKSSLKYSDKDIKSYQKKFPEDPLDVNFVG